MRNIVRATPRTHDRNMEPAKYLLILYNYRVTLTNKGQIFVNKSVDIASML